MSDKIKIHVFRVQLDTRMWVFVAENGDFLLKTAKSKNKGYALVARKLGCDVSDLHVVRYKGIGRLSEVSLSILHIKDEYEAEES